jgi:hypothetical protein
MTEKKASREDRITDLKVVDNVGMLDGIDLDSLSDEEFDLLEDEVCTYAVNRAAAWEKQFKK